MVAARPKVRTSSPVLIGRSDDESADPWSPSISMKVRVLRRSGRSHGIVASVRKHSGHMSGNWSQHALASPRRGNRTTMQSHNGAYACLVVVKGQVALCSVKLVRLESTYLAMLSQMCVCGVEPHQAPVAMQAKLCSSTVKLARMRRTDTQHGGVLHSSWHYASCRCR